MRVGGQVTQGWGDVDGEGESGGSAWLHVPARSRLRLVLLSVEAARYVGHWVEGRMRLCTGSDCPHHLRNAGTQARWAFSVLDVDTRARGFFEIGKDVARVIAAAQAEEGRLRGLTFSFRKEGQTLRGRILVTREAPMVGLDLLPDAEDVAGALRRQWGAGETIGALGIPNTPGDVERAGRYQFAAAAGDVDD